jgi:methylmalonyl-CoA mutase
MGPIPQHKARADFTTGFFEVGGFEILTNNGFSTVEEAARAALDSDAPIVVICSTDKTYPDIVPALTGQIKSAKPDLTVILAGKPAAEHEASYKEAGLDDFIFIRSNCHEVLLNLQKKCGLPGRREHS